MKGKISKLFSILLTIIMVVNTLSTNTLAAESGSTSAVSKTLETENQEQAEEITEERTEYTKRFRMNNGLYMAAVYAEPVHYMENGEWKEIDNTLQTKWEGLERVYSNTAGVWDVRFPQKMGKNDQISITKGGYTLSFGLDGELNTGQNQEKSNETAAFSVRDYTQTYSVEEAHTVTAELQPIDISKQKEAAEYEEMVAEKLASGLLYENVYDNTSIQYELNSNRVKESVIMNEYSSTLAGYRYTLKTGKLVPVLAEDGHIDFYDEEMESVVMVMPSPFLVDANKEYNYNIEVELTQIGREYSLAYLLPQEWLADSERAWPVVLDPIITTDLDINNILDVTVSEEMVFEDTIGVLDCGYRPYRGIERFFIQYADIPEIKGSETVVAASVTMYKPGNSSVSSTIEVHKVNETWNSTGLTWANKPAHNALIEDYTIVKDAGYYNWDVTDIVRGWYSGSNTGMMFKCSDILEAAGENVWEQFYSSDYSEYYNLKPALYISYRHNNGIEPYYTYQTMSAGHAGTAYISDSTGQLKVVKQIAEYASTVNPFSMNLVYNSDYFAVKAAASDNIQSTHGRDMVFGNGFSLDMIQTLKEAELENAVGSYLVYHDGDGTDHYFAKQEDGTYKDEDGLGLTISVSGSVHTMTDEKGNSWIFKDGILTEMTDETGNIIWIDYERSGVGPWFYYIYQRNKGGEDIRVATVFYKSGTSYVETLIDAAGRTYTFTYTDHKLTQIALEGTPIVRYDYYENQLIGMKDLESGYQLWFTYSGGKIATYQEWVGSFPGAIVGITYRTDSTVYRDYGADRTQNTNDDLQTHYAFDYAGRTVNACTTDAGGNVTGVSNAVYSGTGATANVRTNNRTMRTVSAGAAGQNLLPNSSFESALTGWTTMGVDSSANVIVRIDDYEGMQHTGGYSLCGYMPADYPDVIGAYASLALAAGSTYTFSGYINTKYITQNSGWSVYLKVEAPDGTAWYSEDVTYNNGEKWVRPYVTFTTPAAGTYKLEVCCENGTGWFYADDFQLESGDAPSNRNLIYNGNFNAGLQDWLYSDGVWCDYSTGESTYYVGVTGDPSWNRYTWQNIEVDLPGSETYVLSGRAWADSVPDNVDTVSEENYAEDATKRFGLQAILIYSDGTKEYHYVPFCPDVNYWQYASLAIVPKQPAKTLHMIQVVCAYERNANSVWFDDISLVREAAQTMRYDDEGNLVSVTTTGLKEQTSTYENGNLIAAYTGGSGIYTYTYDTTYQHRLTSVSDGVVRQTMNYDSYGNTVSTAYQSILDWKTMDTSASYSSDGNRIASVTDAAGNTTSYGYSSGLSTALGLATIITDPKNITNYYTYDRFGRLLKNSLKNTAEIGYVYEKGQLSAIIRSNGGVNAQTYHFTYDIWGNRTGVFVGGRQLAGYVYGEQNGYLTARNYGNGDSVFYTYDNLGRVKTVTYSDGRILTYTYTGEGTLHSIHDSVTGRTQHYTYDSLERMTRFESGDFYSDFDYDEYNRISTQYYKSKVLGEGLETYTYDSDSSNYVSDGTLTSMRMVSGDTIVYYHDIVQRLLDKHIYSEREGGGLWEEYYYQDGPVDNTTTSLVSQKKTWSDNDTQIHNFLYTYDAGGNILTETDTINSKSVTYSYDNQNQLTQAVHGDGRTENYTYDTAGNLLTFNNGISSHMYTYGDADWKDLLTAVDGVELTYDSIGNPLTYYNGDAYTMTWMEGRKLQTVGVDGNSTTYEYDHSGLRTKKTNQDGSHTKYYMGGDRTVGEIRYDSNGAITLYMRYIFDETGSVIGISLWYAGDSSWSNYYFLKNLQGDILQMYRASDNALVAEYTYDSWGNILNATGELAETNPFRYRGYYYDEETGFYYVSSRYYDPEIGRFLNADSLINQSSVIGNNMFAYCLNNPVNMSDNTGNLPFFVVTAAIGAVAGAVVGGVKAAKAGKSVLKGVLVGAAVGGLAGAGLGAGLGMISGFGATATASQVGAGLGAIATGTGAAISSAVVPATEKAKQVFWAGGQAASKAADTFAKLSRTGSTIANTPAGREIIAKTKDIPWEQAKPMWEAASLQFAQQASGIVNVFIYAPNFSSSSIFITTELPALLSNPNVNEIIINIFGG